MYVSVYVPQRDCIKKRRVHVICMCVYYCVYTECKTHVLLRKNIEQIKKAGHVTVTDLMTPNMASS